VEFLIKKPKENLAQLARILGYQVVRFDPTGESNLVRPLTGSYPRFHLYVKTKNNGLIFNLHLDQKRPSYGRETAHSGEYDGDLVEAERQRILQALEKNNC
jgi:hypothetical protein